MPTSEEEKQEQEHHQDLEALYGPLAPYSEHRPGDSITYEQEGVRCTGTVLWVCPRGPVSEGGPELRVHYIVEKDQGGWPDTVYPHEIVID